MEKRIEEDIPILGRVHVNFVTLASKIYDIYIKEGEIQRQRETHQLGLISRAYHGINHTRYDYLILQCVISEIADNTFKGTTSAQGSISLFGEKYFGNDIIKSWILLSNFGHCKNTIGDEKALLLKAIQRKGFKSYLINGIKDEELKEWAKLVIDNFNYVDFHHILSLRRIYKSLPRNLIFQSQLITLYKLLLLDSSLTKDVANPLQVEQLKLIHGNIRKLAIISLDSRNSSLPISIDILSTILSFEFYENRYQQTKANEIFNPLLSLLYNTLYLTERSQTFQRSYEIQALSQIGFDYGECIDKAISAGLANSENCNLTHFLRIELHIDFLENIDLKDALRSSLTVKREVNNVEASLDYNPFTSIRVMDFYLIKNQFESNNLPRFLTNIVGVLERQISGTVKNHVRKRKTVIKGIKDGIKRINASEENSDTLITALTDHLLNEAWEYVTSQNIPTFKGILWAILRYHIKDQYYFDIDHHTTKEFKYFGVKLLNGLDFLTSDMEKAISASSNLDRIHELKQLKKSTSRKFEGTTIACLLHINVYDYSKAPDKRMVTDIDSLVLKFNENHMYLELHESKNTSHSFRDARKDINDKLIKVLNKKSKGYRVKEVKGFGAKVVIKHNTQ